MPTRNTLSPTVIDGKIMWKITVAANCRRDTANSRSVIPQPVVRRLHSGWSPRLTTSISPTGANVYRHGDRLRLRPSADSALRPLLQRYESTLSLSADTFVVGAPQTTRRCPFEQLPCLMFFEHGSTRVLRYRQPR